MKVTNIAGVKVYDLSQSKALPDFLSEKARRKLIKNPDFARRIELLQDFNFPAYSRTVRVSRDGRYIMASGGYKPHFKVFDVAEVSMKFERFCDADIVRAEFISDDFQRLCLLCEDRSIIFHSKFGQHDLFKTPFLGRDLAIDRETCDLYIATSKPTILRFNMVEGRFRQSWDTVQPEDDSSQGHHAVVWNKYHRLVLASGQDGVLRVWDPRNRKQVAHLDVSTDSYLTSLQFEPTNDSGLTFASGDGKGNCRIFDLRSAQPVLTKEHPYGTEIRGIQFRNNSGSSDDAPICVSADAKQIKGWNWKTGDTLFNIEAKAPLRDITLAPVNKLDAASSGLIFATAEEERVGTFFVPMLGPAPLWASYLESLTEELEEKDQKVYDDWRFVTKEQLEDLGMGALIGTPQVRPWMHGFFVEARTYEKIKAAMTSMEDLKRLQQQAKEKKRGERVVLTKKVKVNADMATRSEKLVTDDRFASLFEDPEFNVDEESYEYKQMFPGGRRAAEKRKQNDDSDDEGDDEPVSDKVVAAPNASNGSDKSKESSRERSKLGLPSKLLPKILVGKSERSIKMKAIVGSGTSKSFLDDDEVDDSSTLVDVKASSQGKSFNNVPMHKRLVEASENSEDVSVVRDAANGEMSITYISKKDQKKKTRRG